jgi:uncharacterized membrane protein
MKALVRCRETHPGRGPIASPRRRCYAGPNRLEKEPDMPILVFLILIILIAQIGFWDTFTAILGGVAMIVLFVLLAIALVVLAGLLLVRRLRRRGQSLP